MKFTITYDMVTSGSVEIDAGSVDEALEKFNEMDPRDGLTGDDPELITGSVVVEAEAS